MKPGRIPGSITVRSPGQPDETFRPMVFLVQTKTQAGTPRVCLMVQDDETVNVADGDEFIVAYVSERVLHG